jgi:tripartite-type tricarboxylate transporter receptor subunit TctC
MEGFIRDQEHQDRRKHLMWKDKLRLATAVCIAAVALPAAGWAQDNYPDRPIHFVAPYGPGGTVDPTMRILAQATQEILGQPTVPENKAGAAGSVGTEYVINSDPDGYTVLVHTNVLASEACLKPNLPYNFLETMRPVRDLVETPFVVLVNPQLPVNTLDELVKYAKEHPGELNYGASGVGSSGQMRGEQFKVNTDTDIAYIPYKDGGSTLAALVAGEIQVAFDTLPGSIGMIRDGRLRLLAVSTPERWPLVPDTPTMKELGYPTLASQWIGAFVRNDVPQPIVDKLSETFDKALQEQGVIDQFSKLGFAIVNKDPDQTLTDMKAETEEWCKVIKAAGISIK